MIVIVLEITRNAMRFQPAKLFSPGKQIYHRKQRKIKSENKDVPSQTIGKIKVYEKLCIHYNTAKRLSKCRLGI